MRTLPYVVVVAVVLVQVACATPRDDYSCIAPERGATASLDLAPRFDTAGLFYEPPSLAPTPRFPRQGTPVTSSACTSFAAVFDGSGDDAPRPTPQAFAELCAALDDDPLLRGLRLASLAWRTEDETIGETVDRSNVLATLVPTSATDVSDDAVIVVRFNVWDGVWRLSPTDHTVNGARFGGTDALRAARLLRVIRDDARWHVQETAIATCEHDGVPLSTEQAPRRITGVSGDVVTLENVCAVDDELRLIFDGDGRLVDGWQNRRVVHIP